MQLPQYARLVDQWASFCARKVSWRRNSTTSTATPANDWYREAIPLAEHRYETYLKERTAEEDSRP